MLFYSKPNHTDRCTCNTECNMFLTEGDRAVFQSVVCTYNNKKTRKQHFIIVTKSSFRVETVEPCKFIGPCSRRYILLRGL